MFTKVYEMCVDVMTFGLLTTALVQESCGAHVRMRRAEETKSREMSWPVEHCFY